MHKIFEVHVLSLDIATVYCELTVHVDAYSYECVLVLGCADLMAFCQSAPVNGLSRSAAGLSRFLADTAQASCVQPSTKSRIVLHAT